MNPRGAAEGLYPSRKASQLEFEAVCESDRLWALSSELWENPRMLAMSFEKLRIWQESMTLAECVHHATKKFPKEELYGLVSQMRRASVSVASNIAEGSQRISDKEFAHFILIARGSLAELQTQMILAMKFSYLSVEQTSKMRDDMERLSRMLYAFRQKLLP